MKNIYSILLDELEKGIPVAIATIIGTKGSTPQVQGASAIFSKKGIIAGTLGGGVLEAEAQDKAREAITRKSSVLYEFDLDAGISDPESAICGGKSLILIDSSPQKYLNLLRNIRISNENRQPGILATLITNHPSGKTEISRFWISENNLNDNSLEPVLLNYKEEIKECLAGNKIHFREIENPLKTKTVVRSILYLEPVFPLARIIIAGAGHIGQAVSHISSLLGFEVTVIDDRPEFCNKDKCPDADHLIIDDIAGTIRNINKTSDSYIVIVTKGHRYDSEVLRQCIGSDAAYIGMIGSRRKIRLIRQKFIDEGWATAEQFDRVHAPIGLEIGSQTVQEIAVSICAQLVQVRSQKTGQKHHPVISAIILAAGESTRMGKPKLLLPYGDKTIIETVIQTVMESDAKHVIVVLGSEKEKIGRQISKNQIIIAENPDYRSGMLSSIQCGLRAVPEGTDTVMIVLGDQPMINGMVIDLLTDTLHHTDKGIIIAVHKGKRGHPILIKIKYKKEIEKLGPENSMHDFTGKFASDILEVETETSDVLRDIDTPEDYNKEIKNRRLS